MGKMVAEPYVHCIATMAGGFGGQGVRRFYSGHFLNQIPKDAKVTPISRSIGTDWVVDEFMLSFTHDTQWDYLLPGIPPTGKRVELPHVLVIKFEKGQVAHEHVWWDQASLLVQVGLLDPVKFPFVGVEQASKLLIGLSREKLKRAVAYIHDQIQTHLTVAGIAREVHISPHHFTLLFKQSTGQSPYQYVIEARTRKARELLASGRYSISEIAHQVGFADQSHLTRHIKRLFGITPKILAAKQQQRHDSDHPDESSKSLTV
jgi:AraC-like DNA-binding protein